MTKPGRNYALDIIRVIACYMVIQLHAGEFFYIGRGNTVINSYDAYWIGWFNTICRISVPLFVMLSGFFLFPVGDVRTFFTKRFSRILIPFVLWCIIYAAYLYGRHYINLSTSLADVANIPLNFGTQVGHLWFVYMLMGIYLFAPVISPWIMSASRKNMEFYLVLWGIALTIPYIHLLVPQIWGETFWNHTPMLYYFSGFLGYVVLANYIKRFHMPPALWNYVLGIALVLVGFAISVYGFLHNLPTEKRLDRLHITWGFETINLAMMTAGAFLMLKNIRINNPEKPFLRLLSDIAAKSYGIYLAHIIVLNPVNSVLNKRLADTPAKIFIISLCAFVLTYALVKLLSYLPKSKWLIG